ncbi:hypothetical protein ZWY2020_049010 [Hordeum vulgare]|nr:hypothetical protein ZWY2020_049010 [Hordeum vulgare]
MGSPSRAVASRGREAARRGVRGHGAGRRDAWPRRGARPAGTAARVGEGEWGGPRPGAATRGARGASYSHARAQAARPWRGRARASVSQGPREAAPVERLRCARSPSLPLMRRGLDASVAASSSAW